LRIISGKYKSRKIFTPGIKDPKKNLIRPTSDRAREMIFDVLQSRLDLEGASCLDLFSGTGAIGFECISRGAGSCKFVDILWKSHDLIMKTADELGCRENISFFKKDALSFFNGTGEEYFDFIFADPPYDYPDFQKLSDEVLKRKFGVFILESGKEVSSPSAEKDFEVLNKKVGYTHFKFFITT
jgi:16S rRNA (guanine966-N2)-methyltransferase